MSLDQVTLIVPFYRNCRMLERQVQEWSKYPKGIQVIVVDDGSPEPAKPIVEAGALEQVSLYRILVDVPWNREEARNLGAAEAKTEWIIHVDIDHILPADSARALLELEPNPKHWYRFPRWRKGRADETRQKDEIAEDVEFGQIKPHIDSYLVRKEIYWKAGGYDLRFSGCLGGGTEFLKRLSAFQKLEILPAQICLHVYTRSEIEDASDWSLSRDRTEGKRRMKVIKPRGPAIRSAWERQL